MESRETPEIRENRKRKKEKNLRKAQEISGNGQGRRGDLFSTQHPGDLPNPLLPFDEKRPGGCIILIRELLHENVMIALPGHLMKMGNGDDLSGLSDLPKKVS